MMIFGYQCLVLWTNTSNQMVVWYCFTRIHLELLGTLGHSWRTITSRFFGISQLLITFNIQTQNLRARRWFIQLTSIPWCLFFTILHWQFPLFLHTMFNWVTMFVCDNGEFKFQLQVNDFLEKGEQLGEDDLLCSLCQHWTCLIKVSLSWLHMRFISPYCSISSKDALSLGVSLWAFKPPHVCLDGYVLISNLYVMFIFPITKFHVFCFKELHMSM
jgi:hypothetical protein